MKRSIAAGLAALALAGCGGGAETTTTASSVSTGGSTSAAASGCTAGGLDAMSALADFQIEMDEAQKAGKITTDQLLASRDKLFNDTQAAQAKQDWAAYCGAIDDTRKELGL